MKEYKVKCIKKMVSSIKVDDILIVVETYEADDHHGNMETMLVFKGDDCGYSSKFFKKICTEERYLLIDDCRGGLDVDAIARNYNEGIRQLKISGPWDVLLLDHDLASYDENGNEKTGYHVMCWLEENPEFLPKKIICVSSNPAGRDKINVVIKKLNKE